SGGDAVDNTEDVPLKQCRLWLWIKAENSMGIGTPMEGELGPTTSAIGQLATAANCDILIPRSKRFRQAEYVARCERQKQESHGLAYWLS
ncbi:MAG TPA: hypothetical protein VLY63_05290, partial [Anaerolineae bacterium]|nr:hypothetical protein [Anaerolineae bacterium]